MERPRVSQGMGTERRRNLDAEVGSTHRTADSQRHTRSVSSNGATPEPGGHRLPIKRLYSRRRAWFCVIFWLAMVTVFVPLAIQFTSRIQSTLSGMKGTPSENVRINVVKNFSTALAFPTAIVWDAKGLPPADADGAWKNLLDTI